MGRKKKKKTKQDARGYSTSVILPKKILPTTSTASAIEFPAQIDQSINHPSHQPSTKETSKTNEQSPVDGVVSKRFFRKIENLYDNLIKIHRATNSCSYSRPYIFFFHILIYRLIFPRGCSRLVVFEHIYKKSSYFVYR